MVFDIHIRSGGLAPARALAVVFLLCFSAATMLGLAPAAHAASATVVQTADADSGNVAVTSIAISLSGTLTAGDLLVVAVATPETPTLSDTLSPPSTFNLAAQSFASTSIYYAVLASSASSDTVTVSIATGTPFLMGSAYEVSGVSAAGVGAATGTGSICASYPCTDSFSTSSPVSYASGAFLVGALMDEGEPGTFTPTATFSSYQSILASGFTEYEVATTSGSTAFSGSDSGGGGGVGYWYEAGAAFPVKAPVSPPTSIPPVDAPAVLHLTTYGGTETTGYRVSLDGSEATYNVPAIDQATLGSQLTNGDISLLPMTLTACSTSVDGAPYIRVSGFSTVSWGGSSTNSTEFVLGGWESSLTPAQGWPSTPSCSAG